MENPENKLADGATEMNPGEVILPGGASNTVAVEQPQVEPKQSFKFTGDESPAPEQSQGEGVQWVASEFILHEKTTNWYLAMAGATALIAGLVYLVTRDFISTGVVLFGGFMFGVYASRKPRQLPYLVDDQGVQIGQRNFNYSDFRCFSIVEEGAFSSIVFSPLKRFSPLTTIYYPPEQEPQIVSIISNHLPMEDRKQDPIDKLMHRIGF